MCLDSSKMQFYKSEDGTYRFRLISGGRALSLSRENVDFLLRNLRDPQNFTDEPVVRRQEEGEGRELIFLRDGDRVFLFRLDNQNIVRGINISAQDRIAISTTHSDFLKYWANHQNPDMIELLMACLIHVKEDYKRAELFFKTACNVLEVTECPKNYVVEAVKRLGFSPSSRLSASLSLLC